MGYMLCVCLATVLLLKLSLAAKVSQTQCSDGTNDLCTAIDHAECDNAASDPKCKCSDGYIEDSTADSTCVKAKVSQTQCSDGTNDLCTAIDHAECDNAASDPKCKCSDGYIEDSTADSTCVKAKVSQTQCSDGTNDLCADIDHAECDNAASDSKCKCSGGYIEDSTDGSTCVKVLDSTCTDNNADSVCTVDNSECQSSHCKCKDGYTEVEAVCKKVLDSTCTDNNADSVCTVDNSECQSSHCKCKDGYTEVEAVCKKVLDSTCTDNNADSVCTVDNSECQSSHCKCKDGYTEVEAVCKKVLDSTCTDNNADSVCTVDNSECQSSHCKCKDGYTEVEAVCKKVLDSTCTDNNADSVCTVDNSECQSSHCKCKDGYTEVEAVCKKVAGETCTDNADCSSNKCEGTEGDKKCSEENSAQSVQLSAGMIFMSLLVTVFRTFL